MGSTKPTAQVTSDWDSRVPIQDPSACDTHAAGHGHNQSYWEGTRLEMSSGLATTGSPAEPGDRAHRDGSCAHRGVAKELCCIPSERVCQVRATPAWMLSDPIASNRSCLQGLCLKRRLIGVIMGAQSALAVKVYKGKLK